MPRKPADPTANIKEKSTKTKKNIPVVVISGDMVQRYNEAKDQIDRANKVIEALVEDLTEAGLKGVFKHNIEQKDAPKSQISSVRLQDKQPENSKLPEDKIETLLFTWTKKGKKIDSTRVETWFERMKEHDPKIQRGDYAVWGVSATFNSDVFLDPTTERFDLARFNEFVAALDAVSKKFKVLNPLSVTKSMMAAPDFHTRRFKDFDLQMNLNLQEIIPTTTQLEPERPELEEEL